MRMPVRRASAGLGALLVAATSGCGAASKQQAPAPAAPAGAPMQAPAQRESAPGYAQPGYAQPGYAQPTFAQPPPAPSGGTAADQAEPTLADAELALDQSADELGASHNDCGTACKALASMKRSADRICAIVASDADARCQRARDRVHDAEARVKDACGGC